MLKKLLLIGALIAVIPLDRERQTELYMVARTTISDIGNFCDRNPDVCKKGSAAVNSFTSKAQAGAQMMVAIVKEQTAVNADPLAGLLARDGEPAFTANTSPRPVAGRARLPAYGSDARVAEPVVVPSENTLSADDLQPQWRGRALP